VVGCSSSLRVRDKIELHSLCMDKKGLNIRKVSERKLGKSDFVEENRILQFYS